MRQKGPNGKPYSDNTLGDWYHDIQGSSEVREEMLEWLKDVRSAKRTCGFIILMDPAIPEGTVELRDHRTGQPLGRITDLGVSYE
jgi:hypothetical protein